MTDVAKLRDQGLREAEALRPYRQRNYAVKKAANWTCQHQACSKNYGIVVVEVRGGFEARCPKHVGRMKVMPGQWKERD